MSVYLAVIDLIKIVFSGKLVSFLKLLNPEIEQMFKRLDKKLRLRESLFVAQLNYRPQKGSKGQDFVSIFSAKLPYAEKVRRN